MDYYSVPGRFALNLRQPMVVFQQFDKVIIWAQGRIDEEHATLSEVLQKAAIFFVQRACFRIENNHYDILALDREFTPDALRQRYRALISLTHPDKNISGLPTNAAVRINNAYDILRDIEERAKYDVFLAKKIENSAHAFSSTSGTSPLNFVTFKDRLQPYLPNFKQSIFFVIPILFLLSVAILLSFGSGPKDLELVEKKSSYSRKSDQVNLEDIAPTATAGIESRVAARDSVNTDSKDVLKSNANAFSPLANVYQTIVRRVKSVNHKNIQNTENTQNAVVQVASPVILSKDNTELDIKSLNSSINLKSTSSMSANSTANVESNALRQNFSNNTTDANSDPAPPASQLAEARANLTQLISSLERPSEIEFLQSRMIRRGVSGNLFGIVLPQIRDAAVVRVDHFTFNEKLDKNHFVLNGSVAFMLATHSGQLTPYRYAVYAEFKNVDKSSAVSRFELREAR